MTRPLSLRAHLMIGAGFLMIGLFGASIVLWHIMLGHREPPAMFFAILGHAHLFAIVCLACMGIGAAQVQRGWRAIDRVRGHLADIHREPARRLTGRYPAEIAPLATDVNRLLDQRDAMVTRASLAAGDLAHGLKTPLAILTQDAARAARDGHADLAASIGAQVDRMRRQVDTHLARARIDLSRHRAVVPVPVLASLEGIVRTLKRLYGDRELAFEVDVAEAITVLAVREDLDEMLGNVLDNACKWAQASCRVEARVAGGRVVIVIDDDGPGMPAEVRDRLPSRGVRADETAGGSGLGLAIARDLAHAYGGSASLDDAPLGGARVVIDLPAANDPCAG
ncbi:MAG: HAMP domain-containing sensor histidine kinase [Vicinamibacterales bacterium]